MGRVPSLTGAQAGQHVPGWGGLLPLHPARRNCVRVAMIRKRKHKKPGRSDVLPLPGQPTPQENTAVNKFNQLTKAAEYQAKLLELQKTSNEKRFYAAIDTIHHLMAEAEWFAENTPYKFTEHRSYIAGFARTTSRYLRQLALLNNHDAIRTLAVTRRGRDRFIFMHRHIGFGAKTVFVATNYH
jgi:hypothetical protein